MSDVHWSDFAAAEPQMAEQGHALIYRRGDGEGLFVTVAGDGPSPRAPDQRRGR